MEQRETASRWCWSLTPTSAAPRKDTRLPRASLYLVARDRCGSGIEVVQETSTTALAACAQQEGGPAQPYGHGRQGSSSHGAGVGGGAGAGLGGVGCSAVTGAVDGEGAPESF